MTPLRKALLDTNLLLLWIVALADLRMLRDFKRVSHFSMQDAVVLRDLLRQCATILTTPHVLAETSNFLRQAPPHHRPKLTAAMASFAESALEIHTPARELVATAPFEQFGLTDAGLAVLSREVPLITMDHALYGRILAAEGVAVNFHYLRPVRR